MGANFTIPALPWNCHFHLVEIERELINAKVKGLTVKF
jgi:hypothetical protein